MKVGIVMGSDSDFPVVKDAIDVLRKFNIEVEARVLSAHRTPYDAIEYAKTAYDRGIRVIIGAAGKAAHLPGVLAGVSTLPVIGLPIKSSTMDGMDSLLSIVQMPSGVPVASVAINGAKNAGLLAVQMLSTGNEDLHRQFVAYKEEMAAAVRAKDQKIQDMY